MPAKVPDDSPDEFDAGAAARPGNDAAGDLQLKKRARRRLVGAIALALFAIILLPLVMDREPPPSAPEIQVRIPSPESTGIVGKVAAKAPPVQAPPAVPEASARPAEPKVAETNAAETKPGPAPLVAESGSGAKPSSEAKGPPSAAARPEPAAARAEAGKEPARETAKEAASDSAPGVSSKWEVQLGAYQNAGNVAVLIAKVKELRLPIYTEKFETPQGPRTRVRSGPFSTKEAALAAQKRIRIIGVEGSVAPYSK